MSMKISSKTGLLLALALWLCGCTVLPTTRVTGVADHQLQNRLQAIHSWRLEAKLALRSPQQSDSARIQWQQDGDSFDIRLAGPAGMKAAHIYGMPGGARFDQGDRHEQAGSAEMLSQKMIGWPLPVTEMTAWLRGLPSKQLPVQAVSYTAEGWLADIQQDGWRILFSEHRAVDDVVLPGRIEAVRGDTRITLIIKQWQL
jgi:outer membrane lipoprotein LolB